MNNYNHYYGNDNDRGGRHQRQDMDLSEEMDDSLPHPRPFSFFNFDHPRTAILSSNAGQGSCYPDQNENQDLFSKIDTVIKDANLLLDDSKEKYNELKRRRRQLEKAQRRIRKREEESGSDISTDDDNDDEVTAFEYKPAVLVSFDDYTRNGHHVARINGEYGVQNRKITLLLEGQHNIHQTVQCVTDPTDNIHFVEPGIALKFSEDVHHMKQFNIVASDV